MKKNFMLIFQRILIWDFNFKYTVLALATVLFIRCAPRQPSDNQNEGETVPATNQPFLKEFNERFYFKATGTEPFWAVEISEEHIRFKSLVEDFTSFNGPHNDPVQEPGSKVKVYDLETEAGRMKVSVQREECIDAMSGIANDYGVNVEVKRGKDNNYKTFVGCGNYIMDYRLHDIWVLEELDGTLIDGKERPVMEMYAEEARFSLSTGCAHLNGKLFSEHEVLQFKEIKASTDSCDNEEKADLLISHLD
nr:hypothetical protein [Bacteroidota bacterium]